MKISFNVSLFLYPKMEFVFEMKVSKVAKLSHFPVKISRFLGRCSCVQLVKNDFQACQKVKKDPKIKSELKEL